MTCVSKLMSRSACAGLAVAALALSSSTPAFGQLHGFQIAKGCQGPFCDGDEVICDIQFGYNDDFGDTLRIHAAWDVQDAGPGGDMVRLPAVGAEVIGDTFGDGTMIGNDDGVCDPLEVCEGNLEIVAVTGNTTCAVGGSLPCNIGAGSSTLSGLPGDPDPGTVTFQSADYFVQPDDVSPLRDQATVLYEDLCDEPTTSSCGAGILNAGQAPGATPIIRCDDGNDCTADSCESGVCSNEPECTTDDECDNGDACTTDICSADGCCESTPIDCGESDECVTRGCDPITGCFEEPIDCNDDNDCTEDSCDPATGCSNVPECDSDADCDDGDACTTDTCTADGCCERSPVDCGPGDACVDISCDPAVGCVEDPVDCNDNDECTDDSCDPATGCVNEDNGTCGGDFAGCTPGFWKQPHHLQYWEVYSPEDLYNDVFGIDARPGVTLLDAMWTGGGGEFALGRHAVAALLNATSGDVNYPYTVDQIIAGVQEAYETGDFNGIKSGFADANEEGCTVIKDNGNNGEIERASKGRNR